MALRNAFGDLASDESVKKVNAAQSDGSQKTKIVDESGKAVGTTATALDVYIRSVRDLKGTQVTTITSSTLETIIVNAVASSFLDLYGLILTNTSTTDTRVTLRDSNGGPIRAVFSVPAKDTRGFMLPESSGIAQTTVSNNWTATCGTAVASLEITALFIKHT